MFRWWKKKKPDAISVDEGPTDFDPAGTIQPLTVKIVVRNFLSQPPKATLSGVDALFRAGAGELLSSDELLEVCAELEQQGHRDLLHPSLVETLRGSELMMYLSWHATRNVPAEAYDSQSSVDQLIDQFRHDTRR